MIYADKIEGVDAMPSGNTFLTAARPPRKGKKYFSLDEANRALPYVSRIVREITQVYEITMQTHRRLEQAKPGNDSDLQQQYETSIDRLNELMDELRHVGVELKDFEKGLLDFPAVHQGREIYLCWHQGEPFIQAWHEVDAGFSGRQDVTLLMEQH